MVQIAKAPILISLSFVVCVIALFFNLCFGLYCYCNVLNPPQSYHCKPPLLYNRNSALLKTSCTVYTLNFYKKYNLFFEGFNNENMMFFTAIGSLCDVANYVGTCIGGFLLPYLYKRRTDISLAIVQGQLNAISQMLKDNANIINQTQQDIINTQQSHLSLAQNSINDNQQLLESLSEMTSSNKELAKQVNDYKRVCKFIRKQLFISEQNAYALRVHVSNLCSIQGRNIDRRAPFTEVNFQPNEEQKRGRSKEKKMSSNRRRRSVHDIPINKYYNKEKQEDKEQAIRYERVKQSRISKQQQVAARIQQQQQQVQNENRRNCLLQ